jgi:hypothetical protein
MLLAYIQALGKQTIGITPLCGRNKRSNFYLYPSRAKKQQLKRICRSFSISERDNGIGTIIVSPDCLTMLEYALPHEKFGIRR